MARAGMTRWRSRNCGSSSSDGNDEVQRSLDLLDKVLSEFDDIDNNPASGIIGVVERSQSAPSTASWITGGDCKTPEQSEDDGYMSMNGRKAKMLANLKQFDDHHNENGGTPIYNDHPNIRDFPPPPEEAERIISNLLPRVSPCNSSSKKNPMKSDREFLSNIALSLEETALDSSIERRSSTATQTTLPKTKHQRPYGWQKDGNCHQNSRRGKLTNGSSRFASLPYDGAVDYDDSCSSPSSAAWLQLRSSGHQVPPRTSATTAAEKHREVRRCHHLPSSTTDGQQQEQQTQLETAAVDPMSVLKTVLEMTDDDDAANFSDDSLEDVPPPPPPFPPPSVNQQPNSKRSSIAWEVPFDMDAETLLTPGSTKVVGARRRRKSTDRSSTSSLSAIHTLDDWPEPPTNLEDNIFTITSDEDSKEGSFVYGGEMSKKSGSISSTGTYVIRKGSRKSRAQLIICDDSYNNNNNNNNNFPSTMPPTIATPEMKRCSSTFDNIKMLLKEGLVDGLDDSPPDFHPPRRPSNNNNNNLMKVVSLPNLLDSRKLSSPSSDDKKNGIKKNKTNEEIDGDKQSIAVQVSADFSSLNKQIAEQSAGCQTDLELNNCCHHHHVTTITMNARNEEDDPPECPEKDYGGSHHAEQSMKHADKGDNRKSTLDGVGVGGTATEDSSIEDLLTFGAKTKRNKKKSMMKLNVSSSNNNRKSEERTEPTTNPLVVAVDGNGLNEVRTLPASEFCRNLNSPSCEEKTPIVTDLPLSAEVLQQHHHHHHHHEFGPLPPSPVEEVEEEYSDLLLSATGGNCLANGYGAAASTAVCGPPAESSTASSSSYRYFEKKKNDYTNSSRRGTGVSNKVCSSSSADMFAHHRADHHNSSSLKTRSVDAGYTRSHKNQFLGSRKEVPVERRTLPTDLPGTSYRRPYYKRSSHSPRDECAGQVSCSLPETPIFARGCDIPRTPHRNTPEMASSLRATPRLNGVQTTGYVRNLGLGHGTSLGEAMAGAELLRMTGPGRGWYPRHRQPRPASVEHLDRLAPQGLSPNTPVISSWDTRDSRKPLTLPPNLSPKFFQRSPREALRRVTSLLIRKGGNSKDQKSKDVFSSSVIDPHGDFGEPSRQPKRGFFRSLWKRSRQHYSFDPPPPHQ